MTNDEKVNILVVNDLEEKLLVYETILEGLGQNLVMARSGREALRHLLEKEFAVILLDVQMPDMDGLETAAMIRNRRQTAHTPIIFVTAFSDEMHTVQGYSLGAVDYILTPVVPEILRTKVGVFVDLYEKTRQVKRQAEERDRLGAVPRRSGAAAEEATRRSAFLAEASTVLVRSLDYEAIPRGLARQVVPFLGELCAITLIGRGRPGSLAVRAGLGCRARRVRGGGIDRDGVGRRRARPGRHLRPDPGRHGEWAGGMVPRAGPPRAGRIGERNRDLGIGRFGSRPGLRCPWERP